MISISQCKLFVVGLLCLMTISSAATPNIDSLIRLARTERNDSVRRCLLMEINNAYSDNMGKSENKDFYNSADPIIQMAKKLKEEEEEIERLRYEGMGLMNQGKFEASVYFLDSSIALANRSSLTESKKNMHMGMSGQALNHTYLAMGKISSQIDALYNAIQYFERTREPTFGWYRACYFNLGWAFLHLNNYDRAVTSFQRALEISKKDTSGRSAHGFLFELLTVAYIEQGDLTRAKTIIDSKAILNNINKQDSSGYFYTLGCYYYAQNRLDSSVLYFDRMQAATKTNNGWNWVEHHQCSIRAYLKNDRLQTAKRLIDELDNGKEIFTPYEDLNNTKLNLLYYIKAHDTKRIARFFDSLESKTKRLREIEAGSQMQSREAALQLAEYQSKEALKKQKEKLERDNTFALAKSELHLQKIIRNSFIAGFVLLLLLIAVLINRSKLKRTVEMEKVRNRLSRDLHDDIGSTLSSINILSRTAQNSIMTGSEEKTRTSLEKINERSQRLLDSMSDIIWNIKPGNDTIEEVMSRMREYVTTILEAKNINYIFNFPKEKLDCKLTIEVKNNLYLIFKEAVNNLSKYADATEARLTLAFDEKQIRLVVEDNGKGFDETTISHTGGLRNMRHRAEEIKGSIIIATAPGTGARISLTMPRYC